MDQKIKRKKKKKIRSQTTDVSRKLHIATASM